MKLAGKMMVLAFSLFVLGACGGSSTGGGGGGGHGGEGGDCGIDVMRCFQEGICRDEVMAVDACFDDCYDQNLEEDEEEACLRDCEPLELDVTSCLMTECNYTTC